MLHNIFKLLLEMKKWWVAKKQCLRYNHNMENSDRESDDVTPLDLLFSSNYTTREKRNERLDICKGCDRITFATRQCKECGCFMALKTWLKEAECPIGKWISE